MTGVVFLVSLSIPWLFRAPAASAFAPAGLERGPDFTVAPPFELSAGSMAPAARAAAEEVLERFSRATRTRWQAAGWAPGSMTPALAFGSGLDLGAPLVNREAAIRAARAFVGAHPELFRSGDDRLAEPRVRFGLGKWSVQWQEEIGGVPILRSRVSLLMTESGRLCAFGASTFPGITRAEAPILGELEARRIARSHLAEQDLLPGDAVLTRDEVRGPFVLPVTRASVGGNGAVDGDAPALVLGRPILRVAIASATPPAAYEVDVDARTGEVLQRMDILRRDFLGTVSGSTDFPTWCAGLSDGPTSELEVHLSHAGSGTTDLDGAFQIPSGLDIPDTLTAVLSGPFVQVSNVLGDNAYLQAVIQPDVPVVLVWDEGNSGPEERDAFAFTNAMHRMIKSVDPAWDDLDYPLLARVDIMQACNAYWDGESINFFHEGGGCANTARLAGVVAHEYTHGVTDFMYGEDDPPIDMHEGNSDVAGNSLSNSPVFAGFYLDNCVDGMRNSDNDLRWPEDRQGDGHYDGQIIAGFHWHTRQALIEELGYEAGARAALSIWHFARMLGLPQGQQDQVWWSFLADDDDGNLDNGTPHHAALAQAAARHGFEVPESFGSVVIRHLPISCASSPNGESIPVEATLYSLAGPLDPDSLLVFYRTAGQGSYMTARFQPAGEEDLYRALLPGGWPIGSEIEYAVLAVDQEGNRLRRPEAGEYRFVAGFACDDFERAGNWTVGASGDNCPAPGRWTWCDPISVVEPGGIQVQPEDDATPAPGHLCWITGQRDDADGRTTLASPVFNLVGMRWATVRFNRWFQTTHDARGALEFWVNYDGGLNWSTLDRIAGTQEAPIWTSREIQLQPPGGHFGITQFRVVLLGNYSNSTDEGGFDDFILLADDQDPSSAPARTPDRADRVDLRLAGANPSNGFAVLQYALPESGPVRIGVYKIDGSLVRTLVQEEAPAGSHRVEWDQKDGSGRLAPSGVYFVRLSAPSGTETRRILIAR
jgi:hypothetical protein